MNGVSPALLGLIRPQLKPAVEKFLRGGAPADNARELAADVESLVDPSLYRELAATLIALGQLLDRRDLDRRAHALGRQR